MNKLYLAKPDDRTEVLTSEDCRFLHTMNLVTPRVNFISVNQNLNRAYEAIPDGMPQYFHYNGIDIEYVYPLEDKVVSFSDINYSAPILQPFSYVKFQKSLLNFDKIIMVEDIDAEKVIKNNHLEAFVDKFYILNTYDSGRKPFIEYGTSDIMQFTKYYELANRLIESIVKNDFSKLKY